MELIIFCVTITSIMAIMLVGIGVILGRMDKDDNQGQCGADNHSNDLSDDRVWDRSSNDGCNQQMDAEEVINGLQNLRMSASRSEKEYLDHAMVCVNQVARIEKYIKEHEDEIWGYIKSSETGGRI